MAGTGNEAETLKKQGRPRGSKNKPKLNASTTNQSQSALDKQHNRKTIAKKKINISSDEEDLGSEDVSSNGYLKYVFSQQVEHVHTSLLQMVS